MYGIYRIEDEVEDEHKLSILQEDPILNPLLDDLCQWLARTLQIIVTPDNFTGPLQTGDNLCKLALYIANKAQEQGKTCPTLRYKAGAKPFSFQARCNIEAFVKWAKAAGVREACLFETVDIVELKYPRNVLICLLELSRLADVYGVEPPELVKLEKSTKIAWEDLVALTLKRVKKKGDADRMLSVAEVTNAVKEIQQEVAEAEDLGPERTSSIVRKWREFTRKSVRTRTESDRSTLDEEVEEKAGPSQKISIENVILETEEMTASDFGAYTPELLVEDIDLPEEDFNVTVQQEHVVTVCSQPDWDGVRLRGTNSDKRETIASDKAHDNSTAVTPELEKKSEDGEIKKRKRSAHASDEGTTGVPGDFSTVCSPAEESLQVDIDADGGYTNPLCREVDDSLLDQTDSVLAKGSSKPTPSVEEGTKVTWRFVLCYPAVYSDEEETPLSIGQYRSLREKRCCVLLLGILLTLTGTAIGITIGILKPDSGTDSCCNNSTVLPWSIFFTLLAISLLCLISGLSLISLWVVQHLKIKAGKIVDSDTDSQPLYGSIT